MASILLLTASPRPGSFSTQIAAELAERLRATDPAKALVHRDLAANPLPHMDSGFAAGIHKPTEALSRVGKTFRFTANGPEGLGRGKKAYIVLASRGIYSEDPAGLSIMPRPI
nr:NAD(P)H-dependent oxidoreductase [Sinorhizobium meliloti]